MENIGQANVFHEFLDFLRFWAGPSRGQYVQGTLVLYQTIIKNNWQTLTKT